MEDIHQRALPAATWAEYSCGISYHASWLEAIYHHQTNNEDGTN
jgi:hypothetical protein